MTTSKTYKYDFSSKYADDDVNDDDSVEERLTNKTSVVRKSNPSYRGDRWTNPDDAILDDEEEEYEYDEDNERRAPSRSIQACMTYFHTVLFSAWIMLRPRGSMTIDTDDQQQGTSSLISSYRRRRRHYQNDDDLQQLTIQLRAFMLFLLLWSLFFWCWAVLNTLSMTTGQDLGMYSFGSVILSSTYVLIKTVSIQPTIISCRTRVLLSTSHVMVTLNYVLGIVFACTVDEQIYVWFATYCALFTILWAVIALHAFQLTLRLHQAQQHDDVAANEQHRPYTSILTTTTREED